MKKVMLVFGTRPEAIKMCPLVNELKTRKSIQTVVCVTGQHREMLEQALDAFGVKPDLNLDVMKDRQTLFDVLGAILPKLQETYLRERPDVALVHGDVSTAFAAALAAFYLKIPVGHVEAGLRTHDLNSPFPEEFNRRAVSLISEFDFAPTERAKENLLREGKKPERVWVTGNTVVDALKTTVREKYASPILDWAKGCKLVFMTAHRRENLGDPMKRMFRAVRRAVEERPDLKIVYPVHLNPSVRQCARDAFDGCDRVMLVEPVDVFDSHNLLARSNFVLTDSGGVQEEATALGVPTLVLRDATERPEGVEAGTLKLVGTDEENVYRAILQLLDDRDVYDAMANAPNPYGDGYASKRIADVLEAILDDGSADARS